MRVPDNFINCVVFAGYREQNQNSKEPKIGGTAFLYAQPQKNVKNHYHLYLITTKHSIEFIGQHSSDGKVHLRFNKKIGENEETEKTYSWMSTEVKDWKHHPQTDISIFSWLEDRSGGMNDLDVVAVMSNMAADKNLVRTELIGIGDEVLTVGLFSKRAGEKRNVPIIRIGNIAANPDENETVNTKYIKDIEAYLVELRSIGGLSGSPVFVNLGGSKVPALAGMRSNSRVLERSPTLIKDSIFLLGMMTAHWNTGEVEMDIDITSDDKEALNTGIGVVIPFWKIQELLNDPELEIERNKVEKKFLDIK